MKLCISICRDACAGRAVTSEDSREGVANMVDFSKKRKKSTRIMAAVICILLVAGMVIGLLVTAF